MRQAVIVSGRNAFSAGVAAKAARFCLMSRQAGSTSESPVTAATAAPVFRRQRLLRRLEIGARVAHGDRHARAALEHPMHRAVEDAGEVRGVHRGVSRVMRGDRGGECVGRQHARRSGAATQGGTASTTASREPEFHAVVGELHSPATRSRAKRSALQRPFVADEDALRSKCWVSGSSKARARDREGIQGSDVSALQRLRRVRREQVERRVLRARVQRGERQGTPEPLGREASAGDGPRSRRA